ncbi:MAG: putative PEP-binding protein [Actinomycetota bacterium]
MQPNELPSWAADDNHEIVSFGFGRHAGTAVFAHTEAPTDSMLVLDSVSDVPSSIPAEVIALLIRTAVSPYSHDAWALWSLGLPAATGIGDADITAGQILEVDFDALAGEPIIEPRSTVPPLEVYSEVASISDLAGASRFGVLTIENLLSLEVEAAVALLTEIVERQGWCDIRYFNEFPQPAAGKSLRSRRGSLLAEDASLFERYVQLIASAGLKSDEVVAILPMVSTPVELADFQAAVSAVASRVGCTVETPAACLLPPEAFRSLATVEIGINDLSHFTTGWDRNDPHGRLMPFYRLDASVAKLTQLAISSCSAAGLEPRVGLDLRPSAGLARQLQAHDVTRVSCPSQLAARWSGI